MSWYSSFWPRGCYMAAYYCSFNSLLVFLLMYVCIYTHPSMYWWIKIAIRGLCRYHPVDCAEEVTGFFSYKLQLHHKENEKKLASVDITCFPVVCGPHPSQTAQSRTSFESSHAASIGACMILQWRGFTWWGPGQGIWGRSPPEAEAKCEISMQFLTFSCRKLRA